MTDHDHDHCDICGRQVPTFDQQALIGDPERLCGDCWADVYRLVNGRRVSPPSIRVLRRAAEEAQAAERAQDVELARAAAAAESAAALSQAAERIRAAGPGAP